MGEEKTFFSWMCIHTPEGSPYLLFYLYNFQHCSPFWYIRLLFVLSNSALHYWITVFFDSLEMTRIDNLYFCIIITHTLENCVCGDLWWRWGWGERLVIVFSCILSEWLSVIPYFTYHFPLSISWLSWKRFIEFHLNF